ncbi:MAG: hypothetical protein HAW59_07010 [Betaproteobacteria bacterium]|nr:hypothetical protein [Betaproteobacteria bacterium]
MKDLGKPAKMELFFPHRGSISCPCRIDFGGNEIRVEYEDDCGTVVYYGRSAKHGHFRLFCPELQGKATLHRSSNAGTVFEGRWEESGYHGMWQITLRD